MRKHISVVAQSSPTPTSSGSPSTNRVLLRALRCCLPTGLPRLHPEKRQFSLVPLLRKHKRRPTSTRMQQDKDATHSGRGSLVQSIRKAEPSCSLLCRISFSTFSVLSLSSSVSHAVKQRCTYSFMAWGQS